MKKIAFVLRALPNPRMRKRIELAKTISNASVISWDMGFGEKKYHDEDVDFYPISIKALESDPLKRTFARFRFMYRTAQKLRQIKPDIIHVNLLEMLFVVSPFFLFKKDKPKIIYEVSDLHELTMENHKNIKLKLIKTLLIIAEKFLCKYVDLLIVTSEKFYDVFYKAFMSKDKVLFMPNMPNIAAFKNYQKKSKPQFAIGFVGAIRYLEQMDILVKATDVIDVKVVFAGSTSAQKFEYFVEEHSTNENIIFTGRFDYNKDISTIYEGLDCVYSVYDADNANVRIALPNKLYEAIYCELPIIVAKNTYLAELVLDMGIGVAVAHDSVDELRDAIIRLKDDRDFYDEIVENCKKNKHMIKLEQYNNKLLNRINKLFDN